MNLEIGVGDHWTLITILGMAIVTAATRVSGVWLMRRTVVTGRLAGALEAMPGAVLMAIVAPVAFSSGPAEALAAAITILLAWRAPTLVAVIGGVGSVVLLRFLLG